MAIVYSSSHTFLRSSSSSSSYPSSSSSSSSPCLRFRNRCSLSTTSRCFSSGAVTIEKSTLRVAEAFSEDELWATACLRIRSFQKFIPNSYNIQDHKKYLAKHEFEAMIERVSGKRVGFRRVSCVNATLPLEQVSSLAEELCAECKFLDNGEDRVVVGTLDINQCLSLPDELTGLKPEGSAANYARAYLSNVCVGEELHRNGLGYAVIAKSKAIAREWGITDLYVHVAVDNDPAKNLYLKSGFVFENDEPAWQARFLDRPRRILLWTGLGGDLL